MSDDARLVDAGETGVFRLEGALTFDTAGALCEAGARLFAEGGSARVTLAGVDRADTAGLAVLVDWLSRARETGGVLELLEPPHQLVAIARVSGVDTMLGFTAMDEGVAAPIARSDGDNDGS